jgi:predicted MFS family arabinose efflux permease
MALLGLNSVVLFDAASYLLAGALIALVAAPGTRAASAPAQTTLGAAWLAVWRELREGLALVRRERQVAGLFLVTGVAVLADGILSALLVVFVSDIIGGGAAALGWVLTARGVGGLVGGLLIGALGETVRPARLLTLCLTVFGGLLLITFNVPELSLVLVLVTLVGVAAAGWQISIQAMLQSSVTDAYRWRIFGAFGTVTALLGLAGMALAGGLAGSVGALPLLDVSAALNLVAAGLAFALLGERPRASIHEAHEGQEVRMSVER